MKICSLCGARVLEEEISRHGPHVDKDGKQLEFRLEEVIDEP